jgi:hypothetical protein
MRWLIAHLQSDQLHKTAHHLCRTQHFQFFQIVRGMIKHLVIVEVRPQFRVLSKELQDVQALAVQPLVNVAAHLQQHHLDLPLSSLKRKDSPDDSSDNSAGNAGTCGQDCWIH